eukprot:CAMPEP_0113524102 /NCGR_PEP_ID=MMETSP0014_2-20120614/46046_1 /TAXON_ID=2857 /ORGANISM="Nitzschia sp." /LENGTH=449 /DNA_ID=CAMNT_0000422209 /DNA_START=109 /DNA_END=1457 /DNA_ORIENTATION=+ /assembly_acc=CAM_ASM_000159
MKSFQSNSLDKPVMKRTVSSSSSSSSLASASFSLPPPLSSSVDLSPVDAAIQLNNSAVTMVSDGHNINEDVVVDMLSKALSHLKKYAAATDNCDLSLSTNAASDVGGRSRSHSSDRDAGNELDTVITAVSCPTNDREADESQTVRMYDRLMVISPSISAYLHSAATGRSKNLSGLCCCCIVYNLAAMHHRAAMKCRESVGSFETTATADRTKAYMLYDIVIKTTAKMIQRQQPHEWDRRKDSSQNHTVQRLGGVLHGMKCRTAGSFETTNMVDRTKAYMLYDIVVKTSAKMIQRQQQHERDCRQMSSQSHAVQRHGWCFMAPASFRAVALNNLLSMSLSLPMPDLHHSRRRSSSTCFVEQAMNELSGILTFCRVTKAEYDDRLRTQAQQQEQQEDTDTDMIDAAESGGDEDGTSRPSSFVGGFLTDDDLDSMALNVVVGSARRTVAAAA